MNMGVMMRHWGMYMVGIVYFWCTSLMLICVKFCLARGTDSVITNAGVTMRRRCTSMGQCFFGAHWCVYLCRAPPGQGYGQHDNEYGHYDTLSGYVHRFIMYFLCSLMGYLCRALPGQGYGQCDNERGHYDAQ